LVILVLASLLLILVANPAASRPASNDPRKQREEVKRQQAEVASQVDTLKATGAEVSKALDALDANVRAQEAALADARLAAEQATADAAAARAAELEAERQLRELRTELQQIAIAAYIDPSESDSVDLLQSASMSDAVVKRALIGLRAGGNLDVTDRVEAAREDLMAEREAADTAAAQAALRTQEVETRLTEVEQARAQQQAFATDVETRLNTALAESANLAALDQQLADQIAAQEAELAARAARAGGRGSGSPFQRGDISLTTVRGITVASSIADELEGLLAAAQADGFVLHGGGYRDPEQQIALRRAHCGPTDYDIYEKPASQCHPATAPPGYSMHERGLAIDFTWNGAVISSRSNPAFKWLAANAARYGFYNLPSEPWHWSVNGS